VPQTTTVEEENGWAVFKVRTDLDFSSADEFRKIYSIWMEEHNLNAVVDLRSCPFIDSFGLGMLVGFLKRMREENQQEVRLVVDDQKMIRTLTITNLIRVFSVHPSPNDASKGTNRLEPAKRS
jgi:anti-sigma B factor antagonist